MPRMSPQEAAAKQATRLKSSIPEITAGVNRVTEAPGAKAAKKQDKMLQNLTASITSGRWARNVSAVTLEDWKTKMTTVGVNRVASGIDAARGKVEKFYEQLLPYQDTIRTELASMPDLTLEDNINRAIHNMRQMSKFSFKR